ncbi:zinc-ribbon domain containing protein [Clostridium sp. AF32-12BH]|uniref:zinc-ribbon domain containing protein n=1 Tax=Clostridium sp. AF32-12BH TaxID=2292006 RepID=UPI000E527B69|nr:zinc-ribbon domain containing protein [Clostridium sp. AF32-12BH]RHP47012.1 hypothetical protein DWZ40_08900 [Clostridium sp. AF32-12BH]
MAALGYRIWFDGKKFVADDNATEVHYDAGIHDSTTGWFCDKYSADKAVTQYNKSCLDDVVQCKECGKYFWQKHTEVHWYVERGMTPPRRCWSCRQKRKRETK